MNLFASTYWPIALTLGMLLCAALLGGWIARLLRLPRVTAYLLVGLMFSPSTYALLPTSLQSYFPRIHEEHFQFLDPMGKLAMAMVLFTIGCHFPLTRFRRVLRRVLRISAGELGLTFLLVGLGLWLLPLGLSWQSALLFAVLAMATAPATTILVLKENESEGPITEFSTALVAINNLVAVVLFEVLYRAVHFHQHGSEVGLAYEFGGFAADLFGSAAIGVVAGLVTSYACGFLSLRSWSVLLVGVATLVLGLCGRFDVPYLLAFLAMGATVANSSDLAEKMVAELDRLTGLLCVIFFVIHGAEMDIGALEKAGYVGIAYVVLRSLGKYFGVFFTADAHHDGRDVKHWLGATLLAQAGAAIALSAIAAEGLGEMGAELQSVILGTVIIFEIAGPILIRISLLQSGEVPLTHAIRHTTTTPLGQLSTMFNRLMVAFGMDPFAGRDRGELTVKNLTRENVRPVPASASFKDVIGFLEHSHDNALPVVDSSQELKGILRYENLQHTLFDPDLGELVRAEDLATPALDVLYPDETLDHAWRLFRKNRFDSMMVVTREEPHRFIGVVRRRELFRLFLEHDNPTRDQ